MAYVSSEELHKKFDVIIYGTGLTESILSAALSRNGVPVLHIDANHFYGGEWGSLMYREFMDFCDLAASPPPASNPDLDPPESDSTSHHYSLCSCLSSLYDNFVQESVEDPAESPEPDTMDSVGNALGPPAESSALPATTSDDTDTSNKDTPDGTVTNEIITQDIAEEVPALPAPESPQAPTPNQAVANENIPPLHTSNESSPPPEHPQTPPDQDQQDTTAARESPPAPDPAPVVKPALLSWTELKSQYRMFTFDLWPKLIYATDPFVDMIVKSTVTKYLEFKAVNKIATVLEGELAPVPASRADVFTSKTVSVLEKRLLMRFVNFVMDPEKNAEEVERFRGRPFSQLLEHMNLSAKLCGLVQSSIAQVDSGATTETALERSRFYLQSIGRYSNSPYLWPVYGVGELPQAFCRMSAVFGGVYMLRKEIRYLEIVESEGAKMCCSVRDNENATFSCKHVILSSSFVPSISPTTRYSRAILVTNRKLSPAHCPDVRSDVGFITVPSHALGPDQPHTVKIIELSANSQSAPEGSYLVHLTSLARLSAKEDLLPAVSFLFHNSSDRSDMPPKPKVLSAIYYNYSSRQAPADDSSRIADNVHLISSPDIQPSYQQLLSDAQAVFQRICPGDDFLPPPPDPEDVVYEPPEPEPAQGEGADQGGEGGQGDESGSTDIGGNSELLNGDSDEK